MQNKIQAYNLRSTAFIWNIFQYEYLMKYMEISVLTV
jgi:hypothetical protein